MQWGTSSVGIGFRADSSYYRNHPLSRMANSNDIACLNSPANVWSNVVYKLTSGGLHSLIAWFFFHSMLHLACHSFLTPVNCLTTQFGCNNGRCVTSSDRCDNFNDCGDNSDEAVCSEFYRAKVAALNACLGESVKGCYVVIASLSINGVQHENWSPHSGCFMKICLWTRIEIHVKGTLRELEGFFGVFENTSTLGL